MTTLLSLFKNCLIGFVAFLSLALITYNDPFVATASFLALVVIASSTIIKVIKIFAASKHLAKTKNNTIEIENACSLNSKNTISERLDPEYLFNEASSSYLDIDPYMQQFNLNLINHKIKNCKLNQIIHDKKRAYLNKEMDLI